MALLANFTGTAGVLSTAYLSDSGHALIKSPGAANSSHPQLSGSGSLVAQETNATHIYHWDWAPAGPNYASGNWFSLPDMRGGTAIGSTARQQGAANTAYVCWWFNNFGAPYFEIYKVVAGAVTSLAVVAGALTVGDAYQPICEPHAGGVRFFVQRASDGAWWDGDTWEAVKAPVLTSADTSIAAAGFAGLIFSTGSSLGTLAIDQAIAADASTGPVITGPSGAAGAASSTANVAEGASTGPTFSTSIALGTGYPTLTGTDASLWTLTSLTSTSWRVDPSPAKNFESPTDAGANNVHDVVFNASATVSQSCAITITNVNEAPTFTGAISVPTLTQSVAMTPVSFASLFGDPDAGDTATYSQIGTWPDGVAIAGTTIAGTPTTVGTSSNLRVRRTDALGLTVDSNLFSIQVDAAGAAPTVATQPSNQTADEGTTATFTAAFDNSPTAFAWQYADAPYSSWAAVSGGSGAATASYTTAALIAGMNGRRFRCTATNAFGSVVTDGAAQLTVNPVAGAGTITTDPFREWGDTNDWAPGTIIDYVWIERLADAVNVQTLTAQALNPSSRLILSGAGIVSGQDYLVRARLADGSALGYKKYTAA